MEQLSFLDLQAVDVYPVHDDGAAVFVDGENRVVMGMLCFEIPLGLDDDPAVVGEWLKRRIRKVEQKYAALILEELGAA